MAKASSSSTVLLVSSVMRSVSRPAPPLMTSWLLNQLMVPSPRMNTSSPASPYRVSFPALLVSVSFPSPPINTSFFEVPIRLSSPMPAVTYKTAAALELRLFSTPPSSTTTEKDLGVGFGSTAAFR